MPRSFYETVAIYGPGRDAPARCLGGGMVPCRLCFARTFRANGNVRGRLPHFVTLPTTFRRVVGKIRNTTDGRREGETLAATRPCALFQGFIFFYSGPAEVKGRIISIITFVLSTHICVFEGKRGGGRSGGRDGPHNFVSIQPH